VSHLLSDWRADPARRSWPRIAELLVALLLILSAFALGMAVRRPAPAAAPAVRTVTLPQGATRVEAGVPVGYAATQAGAVDAATNYTVALNGQTILHLDQVRAAEAVMATPGYRAQLLAEGDRSQRALDSSFGLSYNASHGIPVVIRLIPIAFHVDSYDGSHAGVSIWAVWILAEGGILIAQQHWLTATVLLEWSGGDWKVAGASQRAGPVPSPPQGGTDATSQLPPQLTGYGEYQHVAP
jgi:hypothetical protein